MVYDSKPVHEFTFTPSFSFFINAESEDEIKKLAGALKDGGKELMPLANYGFSKQFAYVSLRCVMLCCVVLSVHALMSVCLRSQVGAGQVRRFMANDSELSARVLFARDFVVTHVM